MRRYPTYGIYIGIERDGELLEWTNWRLDTEWLKQRNERRALANDQRCITRQLGFRVKRNSRYKRK